MPGCYESKFNRKGLGAPNFRNKPMRDYPIRDSLPFDEQKSVEQKDRPAQILPHQIYTTPLTSRGYRTRAGGFESFQFRSYRASA
jgi:hypothetical protein